MCIRDSSCPIHITPRIALSKYNERLPQEPSGLRASQVSPVRSLSLFYNDFLQKSSKMKLILSICYFSGSIPWPPPSSSQSAQVSLFPAHRTRWPTHTLSLPFVQSQYILAPPYGFPPCCHSSPLPRDLYFPQSESDSPVPQRHAQGRWCCQGSAHLTYVSGNYQLHAGVRYRVYHDRRRTFHVNDYHGHVCLSAHL